MYTVKFTSKFKKDYKLYQKRGYDMNKIKEVISLVASGTSQDVLVADYSDHALKGNWKGFRECHILPDWLLVYEIIEDTLVLSLARTGSHSDLGLY